MELSNPTILFDGVCTFCDGTVNFIIDRDPKALFRFCPLQSELAKKLLAEQGLVADNEMLSSIVLVYKGKLYFKTDAVLRIARLMGGGWVLFYPLLIVPRFIRDFAYTLFAKNRYRWFGKMDQCRVPTPELKARYLA
jgi:predicted DCC family thiol-disulfide oxidoreductase YuxK